MSPCRIRGANAVLSDAERGASAAFPRYATVGAVIIAPSPCARRSQGCLGERRRG